MAIHLIRNGDKINKVIKEIIITDNSTAPDNGSNYDKKIGYIPTGSTLQVLTDTTMTVFIFNAESGLVNSTTGYQEGVWIAL